MHFPDSKGAHPPSDNPNAHNVINVIEFDFKRSVSFEREPCVKT